MSRDIDTCPCGLCSVCNCYLRDRDREEWERLAAQATSPAELERIRRLYETRQRVL